jgi:hypothetical protein
MNMFSRQAPIHSYTTGCLCLASNGFAHPYDRTIIAMNPSNDNKESIETSGIEKYDGSFDQDELGVTQIPTETIRAIRNTNDLALYAFLASCSKDWRLNAKHLATHFDCNKEKIYKSIDSLIAQGFLSRNQSRTKGKFVRYHYRLHLRRIDLPCLEKPDTVKPDTENPDTYKTENLQNKKSIIKPFVDLTSTSYKDDELFMQFYSIYPNKQKPEIARKAFYKHKPDQEFVSMLCTDVYKRVENNWKNRHKNKIPFPATYLNGKEWEGEIYEPESNIATFPNKPPRYTMTELMDGVL